MRGQKKHPLEVFRSAGRPLGSGAATPQEVIAEERTPEPQEKAAASREEFQILLTLNGGLILLFVWVVLMGAAYLYGYNRGAASERADRDQAAHAMGRAIAEGAPESGESGPAAGARRPYGVLIITYERSTWKEQFTELRRTLRDKYGVAGLYPWDRGEKIEVMAGEFSSKDDPRLKALEGTIRRISDWPHGRTKDPFATAYVRMHPEDPGRARRATNDAESE